MGFKVRGYIREVPQEKVRDYSLFAIATEGTEREPDYFRLFDGIDRIKVDIIEPETSDDEDASEKRKASSPSKVLEKVKAYISKNQLSAEDGDSLWCVIDVDRWPQLVGEAWPVIPMSSGVQHPGITFEVRYVSGKLVEEVSGREYCWRCAD